MGYLNAGGREENACGPSIKGFFISIYISFYLFIFLSFYLYRRKWITGLYFNLYRKQHVLGE